MAPSVRLEMVPHANGGTLTRRCSHLGSRPAADRRPAIPLRMLPVQLLEFAGTWARNLFWDHLKPPSLSNTTSSTSTVWRWHVSVVGMEWMSGPHILHFFHECFVVGHQQRCDFLHVRRRTAASALVCLLLRGFRHLLLQQQHHL